MNIELFDFEDRKNLERFVGDLYNQFKEVIEDALDESKVYHSMLYFSRIHGSGRETFKRIFP